MIEGEALERTRNAKPFRWEGLRDLTSARARDMVFRRFLLNRKGLLVLVSAGNGNRNAARFSCAIQGVWRIFHAIVISYSSDAKTPQELKWGEVQIERYGQLKGDYPVGLA